MGAPDEPVGELALLRGGLTAAEQGGDRVDVVTGLLHAQQERRERVEHGHHRPGRGSISAADRSAVHRSRRSGHLDQMSDDTRPDPDAAPTPEEDAVPDHREHAKTPHPLDDEALERRAQREREETGAGGPIRDDR